MISDLYLRSSSQAACLKIGVVLDGPQVSQVSCQILGDIRKSNFASLAFIVWNAEAEGRKGLGKRASLYDYYRCRDYRLSPRPNPLEPVDASEMLADCPRRSVPLLKNGNGRHFPQDLVEDLRHLDLDVILWLASGAPKGEILAVPRYGVWALHYGDEEFYRGGPPLFWEVFEKHPCSGVMLQVLAEKPEDSLVLCKSLFPTVLWRWTSRNRFEPYWGSTHLVIRKLWELREHGWDAVRLRAVPPAPYRGKKQKYDSPSNFQMIRWLLPQFGGEYLRRKNPWRTDETDQWRVCLRRSNGPGLLSGKSKDKAGFRWMQIPRGHFYADPVLLEHRGQMWVFVEDYRYDIRRGLLGVAPVNSDLSTGEVEVCLDLPYHLSYPLVFHHEGEVFMIPETVKNESVELWRATDFPLKWTREKTLFRGSCVDTTPLLHEGRWYFFTGLLERMGKAAFSALFSADSLTGEWEHHPGSPISTDARYVRSAGPVLNVEGRLLRPVQDGTGNYGSRMFVEEILELSPARYRSRILHSVEADWEKGLRGVHTYGYCNGIEALDAVWKRERRTIA